MEDYGAQDLAAYLGQITGSKVTVLHSTKNLGSARSLVVIGKSMADALHVGSQSATESEPRAIKSTVSARPNETF